MVNTLYLAAAGTASLDFRVDGTLTGISIATNDAVAGAIEVSFNSSSALTTNDTTGVLAGVTPNGTGGARTEMAVMNESVSVGERIYLHQTGANITRVFLYVDSKTVPPRRR